MYQSSGATNASNKKTERRGNEAKGTAELKDQENGGNAGKYRYRYKPANPNESGVDTRRWERRESIEALTELLSQRPEHEELKEKNILYSGQSYYKKFEHKRQIQSKLSQRLSKKFRPEKEELIGRGILLTEDADENVQLTLADNKRRNSTNLQTKFVTRPSPETLLQKNILRSEDYTGVVEANDRHDIDISTDHYNDDLTITRTPRYQTGSRPEQNVDKRVIK
ncbi:phosphatase and actin regulator 1 [Reticulomyxa filosa]|uniref:Phosphatase and actin regulator 1 n=1 Tax=Reticulomyxa filosa TaxID=46433 RepID=X6MHD8_RETFI|nr:phosphatase and actin regulator 1 [Reticulomyxa filosa]|eukprot:ETO13398.1 phosphatase and actin regulator 1 [Reticulomyxa filosa]